jgi:hypothetical protein
VALAPYSCLASDKPASYNKTSAKVASWHCGWPKFSTVFKAEADFASDCILIRLPPSSCIPLCSPSLPCHLGVAVQCAPNVLLLLSDTIVPFIRHPCEHDPSFIDKVLSEFVVLYQCAWWLRSRIKWLAETPHHLYSWPTRTSVLYYPR